jgi:hypothetical protein
LRGRGGKNSASRAHCSSLSSCRFMTD